MFVSARQGSLLVVLLGCISLPQTAQAQISLYLSAPRASSSGFTNTDVETFESLSTGIKTTSFAAPGYGTNTGITGTYQGTTSNPFYVGPSTDAWSWGSNYFSVGAQSNSANRVTLQLSGSVQYFGIGWGAGDSENRIALYKSGALVGAFNSQTVQTLLAGTTITAVNGTVYNTADYKGQPGNPTINSNENYAFLHFVAPQGIDRIDFYNATTSTGFESDNHTIRLTAPTVAGSSLVFGGSVTVPEPTTLALLFLGSMGLIRARRLR